MAEDATLTIGRVQLRWAPTRRVRRATPRTVGPVLVGLTLAIAAVAAVLVLRTEPASVPAAAPAAPEDAVASLLHELTAAGDAVGYVGPQSLAVVPRDREPIDIATPADLTSGPRYVVAVGDGAVVRDLATSATTILALERGAGTVRVFDRGPAPTSPALTSGAGATAEAPPAGSHVVVAGEHFWAIAERQVASAVGHPPSAAEVTPYWQHLVDANQDILIEPGNPSLLAVGQVIELPPA